MAKMTTDRARISDRRQAAALDYADWLVREGERIEREETDPIKKRLAIIELHERMEAATDLKVEGDE